MEFEKKKNQWFIILKFKFIIMRNRLSKEDFYDQIFD